jgi:7-keto-8-aminopelargonate synthetase-like enzyme
MAILTMHTVLVDIDDKQYELIVSELTDAQKAELESANDPLDELNAARQKLMSAIQFRSNEYEANTIIMRGATLKEKIALALKQKEINTQVQNLGKEIQDIDLKIKTLPKVDTNEKRFDFMVAASEGKSDIEELIKTTSLNYTQVVLEIRQLLSDAKTKN